MSTCILIIHLFPLHVPLMKRRRVCIKDGLSCHRPTCLSSLRGVPCIFIIRISFRVQHNDGCNLFCSICSLLSFSFIIFLPFSFGKGLLRLRWTCLWSSIWMLVSINVVLGRVTAIAHLASWFIDLRRSHKCITLLSLFLVLWHNRISLVSRPFFIYLRKN